MKPKKSLGQNFLVDLNMALKMVEAIGPQPDDIMVEIGPGHGILTRLLQPRVRKLYAVEIDQRFYEELRAKFAGCDNFVLVESDILDFDFSATAADQVRVVGNIPYNITSPILFHTFEYRKQIRDVTLLMQKEVGVRAAAEENCKDYGVLSVLGQALADVELLMKVPPTVFRPRPKVDSVLVRWRFNEERARRIRDEKFFRQIVRRAFNQRRKMLRNSLKDFADLTRFDFTRRPEQLSVEEWIDLANELFEKVQSTTTR
ncbi:MAG: 16S rRNA (adenine(1518)-N(6)/adenine(1519)-N(6))-dimethyltransferase RsmA [candidate division KSB1 bacterium]|nr:16S rRNA (adenine(1518)-N(6)/adenine(1519)-N(6))-dimethyltransferase RsmA [candidate division KSB1 bacterium]MDZ7345483.1 16S rRNA (adenine(1518)-N(6)/adenine(1519)-N(6))-dimethyltransferase RsmA [candidate division KSB1 bacterium]